MYKCGYCDIIIQYGRLRIGDNPIICRKCKTSFKPGNTIFKTGDHLENKITECFLPADEMNLRFTKEQIIRLFTFKKWMQDRLGVHWGHSAWHTIQEKDFLTDLIDYAIWYWEFGPVPEHITEYFKRSSADLPKDYPIKIKKQD